MIEVKEPQRPQPNPRILVIEKEDKLPKNIKNHFKGKRFEFIFIHKENKFKEDFKIILKPTFEVLNYQLGNIYEYE